MHLPALWALSARILYRRTWRSLSALPRCDALSTDGAATTGVRRSIRWAGPHFHLDAIETLICYRRERSVEYRINQIACVVPIIASGIDSIEEKKRRKTACAWAREGGIRVTVHAVVRARQRRHHDRQAALHSRSVGRWSMERRSPSRWLRSVIFFLRWSYEFRSWPRQQREQFNAGGSRSWWIGRIRKADSCCCCCPWWCYCCCCVDSIDSRSIIQPRRTDQLLCSILRPSLLQLVSSYFLQ